MPRPFESGRQRATPNHSMPAPFRSESLSMHPTLTGEGEDRRTRFTGKVAGSATHMQIYLPIAEIPVNVITILAMGLTVGFLSGMFGIGGGFLMTPLLIFLGIPPAIAVGTQSTSVVASSVTGALAHFARRSIDFKMGGVLLVGGAAGSLSGIYLFKLLSSIGQIDLMISVIYVVFLTIIGGLMMIESVQAIRAARNGDFCRRAELSVELADDEQSH